MCLSKNRRSRDPESQISYRRNEEKILESQVWTRTRTRNRKRGTCVVHLNSCKLIKLKYGQALEEEGDGRHTFEREGAKCLLNESAQFSVRGNGAYECCPCQLTNGKDVFKSCSFRETDLTFFLTYHTHIYINYVLEKSEKAKLFIQLIRTLKDGQVDD